MPVFIFKPLGASTQFKRQAAVIAAVGLIAGYSLTLPAFAETGEQSMSSIVPNSTTFRYQFPGLPIVRVSDAGNILRFEGPTGYDHVGVGQIGEGYVLCYGATNAYDTGSAQSGFGPSTNSCAGSSCTFTRTTSDGRMRLRQVIRKDTTQRMVAIEMALTNLGPGSIGSVILRRQIDLDVDTGGALGSGDFTNWFATTERDSVFAWNANNDHAREDHGVVMRHIGKSPGTPLHQPKVTSAILDNSCSPLNIAASNPVTGDYGATIQYNFGTMTAGRTLSARFQYERN